MRFLVDEGCDYPGVRVLREAGHDVASIAVETPGGGRRGSDSYDTAMRGIELGPHVAQNLRLLMSRAGLSPRELAERIATLPDRQIRAVSKRTIESLLGGKANCDWAIPVALSRALNVSVDELLQPQAAGTAAAQAASGSPRIEMDRALERLVFPPIALAYALSAFEDFLCSPQARLEFGGRGKGTTRLKRRRHPALNWDAQITTMDSGGRVVFHRNRRGVVGRDVSGHAGLVVCSALGECRSTRPFLTMAEWDDSKSSRWLKWLAWLDRGFSQIYTPIWPKNNQRICLAFFTRIGAAVHVLELHHELAPELDVPRDEVDLEPELVHGIRKAIERRLGQKTVVDAVDAMESLVKKLREGAPVRRRP